MCTLATIRGACEFVVVVMICELLIMIMLSSAPLMAGPSAMLGVDEIGRFLFDTPPNGTTVQVVEADLLACTSTPTSQRKCMLDYVYAAGLIDGAFHAQMLRATNSSRLLTSRGRRLHENPTYADVMERYRHFRAFGAHEVNASSVNALMRTIETCGRYHLEGFARYTTVLEFDGYIPTANASVWGVAELFAHERYYCDVYHGNYTLADVLFYVDFMKWVDASIPPFVSVSSAIRDVYLVGTGFYSTCTMLIGIALTNCVIHIANNVI